MRRFNVLFMVVFFMSAVLVENLHAKTFTVDEGTLIKVTNYDLIKADRLDDGAIVNFAVAEDVVVDDAVVIKKGTKVKGKVSFVSKEASMGMHGMIAICLISTNAVDGQTISLIGNAQKGLSTGEAVDSGMKSGCMMAICPLFMFQKGESADIAPSSIFRSRTAKEYKIKVK